ncbi:hypothetical protein [Cyanobium gracile]|nr:hypothetical protein [Cyanobium gracile]
MSLAAGLTTLLAATPAFAADPFFKIHFASGPTSSSNGPNGYPGIQGVATYTFSTTNIGQMVLNLENTSTVGTSKLVGTGFDIPSATSSPSFSPPITVANATSIPNWGINTGDSLPPFGQFDICVTTNDPNGTTLSGCDAGAQVFGLSNGQNQNVATFNFTGLSNTASATDYRNAFASLFTTAPDNSFVMRFKNVDIPGVVTDGSDKILATSIERGGNGDQAPGDSVPGPLSVFGAAAAFGYSRKLRQRIKLQQVTD